MQKKQDLNIVWFRNDLRTKDQKSLYEACQQPEPVLGVYCFDPKQYETTKYGFKKTEKYRAKFLIEMVSQLSDNLKSLNISLQVEQDAPAGVFEKLSEKYNIKNVFFQAEWTEEEKQVENAVKSVLKDTQFAEQYNQFLFHPEDVPYDDFSQVPEVYTDFRKKCEKQCEVRDEIPVPEALTRENLQHVNTKIPGLADLGLEDFETDERSAFPFQGGEDAAWKRLKYYFWETKKLQFYKKTRNGLLGTDYSSKFSAWLANGSISAVSIYHEVKKFEKEVKKNQDTYWLIFELIWRDYFKYISLKHGNKIFQLGGISNKEYDWGNSEKAFKQWINGNTPESFVNANMIEIRETGFMSNRGRQNVNSYWAKEWKQDWRIGAAYFEAMLIDYDVHSNWGNWMYNSGVGNDPRDRKFNIKKQAERYDTNGKFQRTWLQESLF
ncbi:DASH family cryptochrome [Psychroflexus sediminis]|uniref:Cryptochrome DASH n=1 Tax=Psychroflexus sediminis TaxID=470826 RepID=A0A1G7YAU1_9FLAO|nr:DASH family cryptochrome [Psychroflexus sediminis]SDG93120.1 deoxyribodipyrimidine photo-lyase (single-stranded DNA-specific) [Psychroflexus sediminis]